MKMVKGILYVFKNFRRILRSARLFKDRRYEEIISIAHADLENKDFDFLSIRNLSFAYAYIGKSDTGFEYFRMLIPQLRDKRLLTKGINYFVLPEWKRENYDKVVERCEYLRQTETGLSGKEVVYKYLLAGYFNNEDYKMVLRTHESAVSEFSNDNDLIEVSNKYKERALAGIEKAGSSGGPPGADIST